jgi:probable F420-dependent oxidoreductase
MQFWQSIARTPTDQIVPLARHAEALGFTGVTMADHLVMPVTMKSSYPYAGGGRGATDQGTPYLDPWLLCAYVARKTESLRFLPYVYVPALRDPFSVAKSISTTALLTGDRLLVGIGVGWMEEEFALVDRPFAGRGRRTDELMAVVDELLSGQMVEHHGEHYDFGPVQMAPVPRQAPPVLVGGHSPVALRRAAKARGWLGVSYDLDAVFPILEAIRVLRSELGRSDEPFEAAVALNARPEPEDLLRLEEAGLTMWVNPVRVRRDGTPPSLDERRAALDRVAERLIVPLGG